MSISKIRLDEKIEFDPIILPKKTIFQLCSLLDSYDGDVKVSNLKSKIKFELNNSILISKLIDGKFPNYIQGARWRRAYHWADSLLAADIVFQMFDGLLLIIDDIFDQVSNRKNANDIFAFEYR